MKSRLPAARVRVNLQIQRVRTRLMRYVIEAGTDASSLLLFDPGALPGDFERAFQTGSGEILEQLDREGRVCWITVDGDGRYLLHVYIDERVPRELDDARSIPSRSRSFQSPPAGSSSPGSEYAFREDDSFLASSPHGRFRSSSARRLPPQGVSYPVSRRLVEQLFRKEATFWEYCLWSSMIVLIPLAVAAWIGLVVIFFTTVHIPFPSFLAPLLTLVFAAPFLVRRLEIYREAKARFTSLEREYPALVVQLEPMRPDQQGLPQAARAIDHMR